MTFFDTIISFTFTGQLKWEPVLVAGLLSFCIFIVKYKVFINMPGLLTQNTTYEIISLFSSKKPTDHNFTFR